MIALFGDDVVAQVDAFIANVNGRTRDQLANLVLAFSAKRADEISRSVFPVLCHSTPG